MWPGRGSSYRIAVTMILNLIWKDITCNGDIKDYKITVKQDVTVPEGLCVTIPCTFTVDKTKTLSNATGYWKQQCRDQSHCPPPDNNYIRVVSSNISEMLSGKKSNFHLMGNLSTGDCSLTINDVKKEDTGMYHFRIEDGKDESLKWNYKDNFLHVTVTESVSKDQETDYKLNVHETVSVPEGQCIAIPCSMEINGNKRFSSNVRGYWRKMSPDNTGCYPVVATNNESVILSDKTQTFRLTGDLSNGDCSLTINDANKEDAGRYQFRIEDTEFRWSYRNKYLNLQVTESVSKDQETDYKLNVQEAVSVPEGQCIAIPCSMEMNENKRFSSNVTGYWRKMSPDDIGCYPVVATNNESVILSDKTQTFRLTGDLSNGDCSLTINDANKEDTGRYQFMIEDTEFRWSYRDKYLNLQVTESVSKDQETDYKLNVQETVTVPEGQCIAIPCSMEINGKKRFSSNVRGYWRKMSPDDTGCYPVVATNNESVILSDKTQTFRLTGDLSNGDCSLTINDANKDDTGRYQFRIEDTEFRWSYRDKYLNLQVTEAGIKREDAESFTIHVTDVTVPEGLCVSIPCSMAINGNQIFSSNVTGYWRKLSPNNTGCYPIVATNNKSINPFSKIQKVHLTGDLSNGDCSMTINDVKKEDTGRYQFRIIDTGFRWFYRNIYLNLQVTELRSPNIILPEKLVLGINQTLTCRRPGLPKCPGTKTEISWEKRKNVHQETNNNNLKESNITFIPSKDDHQTSITCKMTLPGGKSSSKSIILNVEYAPSVSITRDSSGEPVNVSNSLTVNEGDNVTLRCSVDSNPPANVTWRKGEESKYLLRGQVLVIFPNISRQQSDTYTCLAVNEHGRDSVTFHVNVSGPTRNLFTEPKSEIYDIKHIIIGLLCAAFGVLCGFLIPRLFANSRGKQKPPQISTQNIPDSVYMNVHLPSQVEPIVTSEDRSIGLALSDSTGEQTQHYAMINFSKLTPHPRPMTTETLYAEVKKN